MTKRFERWAGTADAWIIGLALVALAIAYVISKLRGG
jgi:hypothetical protein